MSASTLAPPEEVKPHFHEPSPEEFSYRPMSMTAVLAFVMALLSLATVTIWFLLPLAAASAVLSALAIYRIRSANGEFTGMRLASAAAFLSVFTLVAGVGYQVYAYQTEVLQGYDRISFVRDITAKGLVTYEGQTVPHPDLVAMEGKKIFVKGFMYPTGRVTGLKSFLLVKDSDQCCFGGEPKLVDMLGVYMKSPNLADYYSGRVSVAGTFRINREYKGEKLEAVFLLDGVEVKPSRSDFDPMTPVDLTEERARLQEKIQAAAEKLKAEEKQKASDSAAAVPASSQTPAAEAKATEPVPSANTPADVTPPAETPPK